MWEYLLSWDWLKPFLAREIQPVREARPHWTVVISDTTNVHVSRLGSTVDLVMMLDGRVEETNERAEVKITLSDAQTLRELSQLLLNLVPKLEPPYYGADDIGPLWDDESADIYQDVRHVVGEAFADEWLSSPNMHFGLKTPAEIIQSGKGYWVREVLRSIRIGNFS